MKTFARRLITAALTGALLLPALAQAEAGPRKGWNNQSVHHHYYQPAPKKRKNNNAGAAVAAGVIGLAAGAILLGAASRQAQAAPPPVYPVAPVPGPVSPQAGYQPWSPAWYQYCSAKFRSFNPATGTYTTYSGVQRFCQ